MAASATTSGTFDFNALHGNRGELKSVEVCGGPRAQRKQRERHDNWNDEIVVDAGPIVASCCALSSMHSRLIASAGRPEKSSDIPPTIEAAMQPFKTAGEYASALKRWTCATRRVAKLARTKPTKPARVLLPLNFLLPNIMPKAEAIGSAKPDNKSVSEGSEQQIHQASKYGIRGAWRTENERAEHGYGGTEVHGGEEDAREIKDDAGHLAGVRDCRMMPSRPKLKSFAPTCVCSCSRMTAPKIALWNALKAGKFKRKNLRAKGKIRRSA
jgi:hypothetical protein